MSMEGGLKIVVVAGVFAGLLAMPARAHARQAFSEENGPGENVAGFTGLTEEPDHFAAQQSDQDRSDAEQEARDREQERKDLEQEKRDRLQDKLDQMQDLYDAGREALDDGQYQQAEQKFAELAEKNGPRTDAALYWKAYAENQSGRRDTALATIANLKSRFPQSRWKKDAEALEIEVRQSSGHPVNPESQSDEELKTLALQGLMNSDPRRGIQMIEKRLAGTASPKDKAKVLFVLAQNGSPEARDVLVKIAQGQSNPDLQRKAVEYLGIFGGSRAAATLETVYTNSTDAGVKRAVIRSYMISGNREQLFKLAKGEKDESLKRDAIRNLGLVGGQNELQQLYQTEPSTEVRQEILQGFFLAGQSDKLAQVAATDKDPDLRRAAIRNLGLMGNSDVLQSLYAKESDRRTKEEVLNACFISGNAKALVAIAKSEKDPELKKRAVEKLSLMNSKEGNEYLMELLNK
jgi:HEAT repeat protein